MMRFAIALAVVTANLAVGAVVGSVGVIVAATMSRTSDVADLGWGSTIVLVAGLAVVTGAVMQRRVRPITAMIGFFAGEIAACYARDNLDLLPFALVVLGVAAILYGAALGGVRWFLGDNIERTGDGT